MPAAERFDLVLAGGGLANGLIAWRLKAARPRMKLLLLEAGPMLGGNHTWSFHDGDLDTQQREALEPFVAHRWPRHTVRFASHARSLAGGYRSITSERFHAVLTHALGDAVRVGTALDEVAPTRVRTASGDVIDAGAVIDGRGFRPSPALRLRYQKFVGLELRLEQPHGLAEPCLMDASITQFDGYRFAYTLPLDADRLLIEDTYYADRPDLDRAALRSRALAYAATQGWKVAATLREESGVLPIALDGDIDAYLAEAPGQPCSGLRAALFHPTTGYSLPQAMRLADMIVALPDLGAPALAAAIAAHTRRVWRSQAFYRALNRMLFLAGPPDARHRVLSGFYRLPEHTVGRFYGERLSLRDKVRILSGKPPVPIGAAVRALLAGSGR